MNKFYSLLLLLISTMYLKAQAPTQPNFVIIIADDMNDYVQGFDGSPQSKTPNINKIEKKGTTFTNAYCAGPKCAPSRTSFITGKDCFYTQVYNNDDIGCKNFRKNFTEAKGNETVFTIPQMLKDSGNYFTYTISKVMHCYIGYPDYDTTDVPICEKGLSWNKVTVFGDGGDAGEGGGDMPDVLDYGNTNDDGINGFRFTPIPDSMEDNTMDYIATDSAIAFINDYASHPENYCNKPFMLCLGYKRPHGPFFVPQKYFSTDYNVNWGQNPYNKPYNDPVGGTPYNGVVMPPQPDPVWSDYYALPADGVAHSLVEDDYVHDDFLTFGEIKMGETPPPVIQAGLSDSEKTYIIQESERANGIIAYMACIKFIDAQIGRFYTTMQAHPEIYNNTVFIIMSDHGYSLGEKTHWRKGCLWETDIRIPLVIADMRSPAKKTCKRFVTEIDLMPTILDMAGVSYPTFPDGSQYVDGKSIAALVANPNTPFDRPVLSATSLHALAEGTCFPHYSVRDDEWHYIRYQTNGATAPDCDEALSTYQEELYHIGKKKNIDPYEWNNLAYDPAYTSIKNHMATFLPGGVNYLQFDRTGEENEIDVEEESNFNVYPNPTSAVANFSVNNLEEGTAEFVIYDITGREMMHTTVSIPSEGFTQFSIPVNTLEQGYYIAAIKQNSTIRNVNFVVAR